jgi:hypothetical protein
MNKLIHSRPRNGLSDLTGRKSTDSVFFHWLHWTVHAGQTFGRVSSQKYIHYGGINS